MEKKDIRLTIALDETCDRLLKQHSDANSSSCSATVRMLIRQHLKEGETNAQ